jgi:hypothetical protein
MFLYLVRIFSGSKDEEFFKIGVTAHADPRQRFAFGSSSVIDSSLSSQEKIKKLFAGEKYLSDFPYELEVIHSVSYKLEGDALLAEKKLLEVLKPRQHWPAKAFSGHSECFKGDNLVTQIVDHMNENSKEKNAAAPTELLYMVNAAFIKERDPAKKHLLVLKKCLSDTG